MVPLTCKIDDFDDKVRRTVGDIMSKADPISKAMLTSYDSSKDRKVNVKVLGGPKFQAAQLDTVAEFLGIAVKHENGSRLFTNKQALALRIVLEIESFFPAICSECTEEYSLQFQSVDSPKLRCFLCFQGNHNCEQFTDKFQALPTEVPAGMVWLCTNCKSVNNPIKTKEPKARPNSATPSASAAQTPATSGVTTPAAIHSRHPSESEDSEDDKPPFCPEELAKKLKKAKKQTKDVCPELKKGKCPHGISGKTLHNGMPCPNNHPKQCRKFMSFGDNKKKGCDLGTSCDYFHPQHCKSSFQKRQCYNDKCTLVHLAGTKRSKPGSDEKPSTSGNKKRSRFISQSSNAGGLLKDSNNSRESTNPTNGNSFLEIRELLKNMQECFQKEMTALKSHIALQDSKISAMTPMMYRQGYPHLPTNPMPQSSLWPQITQQHPPSFC